MPLYVKDDSTAELVTRLARQRGLSKQAAVTPARNRPNALNLGDCRRSRF